MIQIGFIGYWFGFQILDHLQPTPISISISIFSSKIKKFYYRGENDPMYVSVIEFFYL